MIVPARLPSRNAAVKAVCPVPLLRTALYVPPRPVQPVRFPFLYCFLWRVAQRTEVVMVDVDVDGRPVRPDRPVSLPEHSLANVESLIRGVLPGGCGGVALQ